jgi:ribosomal protein S18 acetylase RimI-like enzyme
MGDMAHINSLVSNIRVVSPVGLARQMLFRVYSDLNPIAYARLSSPPVRRAPLSAAGESSPSVSYYLSNIAVSQNYQNLGIGSALLEAVLSFCHFQHVRFLYGKAKGDSELLAHWYRRHGFVVDADDNIALDLTNI